MRRVDQYDEDQTIRIEPGFDHARLHRRSNRPVGSAERGTATEFLQTEPEGQLSPGDFIARAAAAVPENVDPDSEKNRLLPDGDQWSERLRHMPKRMKAPQFPRPSLQALPLWMGDMRRLRPVAAGLVVLVGAIWLFSSNIIPDSANWVSHTVASGIGKAQAGMSMGLTELRVDGRRHTPTKALEEALGIRKGDSLMKLDLVAARKRIEKLPWVASASVERRLSGVLQVQLREHRAIARLWQGDGYTLISATGSIIPVSAAGPFEGLLRVSGPGAAERTPALIHLIGKHPGLARRITAARRLGDRRWNLHFRNGSRLMLPAGFAPAAWDKFFDLNKRHRLLERGAASFDMRLADRMIIRTGRHIEAETANVATPAAGGKGAVAVRHTSRPLLNPAADRRAWLRERRRERRSRR
jgi:cell division protein FtsQ